MNMAEQDSQDEKRMFLARWLFSPLAGITLRPWLVALWHYGGYIPLRYWPRTLFTTAMAVLNSVLKRLEPKGWKKDRYAVKAPVFIVGHHRSGTTHLWQLLAVNEEFVYPTVTETIFPSTLLIFEKLATTGARWLAPRKRPQDNVKSSKDSPMGEEWALSSSTLLSTHMARHFPAFRQKFKKYLTLREVSRPEQRRWQKALDMLGRKLLYKKGGKGTLLFKAPTHTAKMRLLLDLYPDARFVHIYRHPFVVYRSALNMEQKSLPLCTYHHPRWEQLEEYVQWRYRAMYEAFWEDVKLIPKGQYTEIAFEELEKDRLAAVAKIYKDLQLPGFEKSKPALEKFIASLKGYQKNNYEPLSFAVRQKLKAEWQSVLKHFPYHYEDDAEGF